jgi:hypothetical protein
MKMSQAEGEVSVVSKVWIGQRILGRVLAVPLDYAELYADPDAARRGEVKLDELALGTTCATNGNEDAS